LALLREARWQKHLPLDTFPRICIVDLDGGLDV